MNAAAEAEFNILLATDSYKVRRGRGQVRQRRGAGGERGAVGSGAAGLGACGGPPRGKVRAAAWAGEAGGAWGRRWMEEGWRDGRQEAGPGGAWWGGAARG